MSFEGTVSANTLENSATKNAYRESLTTPEMILPVSATEDAQAFAGLANNPVEPALPPQQVTPVQTDMTSTPGDEILKSLQKISDAQTNSVKNLANQSEQLKASETITMASALEMQKSLMEFQLKQDLISKATGSINQGIQTLFKNQ